jgi:hypothetical protein
MSNRPHECGRDLRFQPAVRAGGRVYGPYGVCDVCGTGLELQVAPPPSHPDAVSIPFSSAQEAFLAAADAELSTQEEVSQ